MNLYALHGFLGHPNDWQCFAEKLKPMHLLPVDIYARMFTPPSQGLLSWGQSFNAQVAASRNGNILMGYSLGGRLALHALFDRPELWQGAILISSHPGGLNSWKKQQRKSKDEQWAKRFIFDHWPTVIADWNAQPIFHRSKALAREDQERQRLAETLVGWSLSKQDDLRSFISAFDKPLLWVVGKHDETAVRYTEQITLKHPLSKIWMAPAGHRVPWDLPEKFITQVSEFCWFLK